MNRENVWGTVYPPPFPSDLLLPTCGGLNLGGCGSSKMYAYKVPLCP